MSGAGQRTVLVTGGAGFIGSNLADRLAGEGHKVRVLDTLARPGVERNLAWLTSRHGDAIEPVIGTVTDEAAVSSAVAGVDAAFHFAAQVAVTSSMVDPRHDLETNVLGTFNLLEALRMRERAVPVIFASSNKVYGDLASVPLQKAGNGYIPADVETHRCGIPESQPLAFHTPYGCSKGAADQYTLDYAHTYRMPAAVVRMSCIYGQRQMGTEDQGWVAHFLIRALEGEPITIYGDGCQVRDICDVADTCSMYLAALRRIDKIAGRALNWGGGPDNAISLRALIEEIGTIVGRAPEVEYSEWRPGDQRWFVADARLAESTLALSGRTPWREGVRNLARWLCEERGLEMAGAADLATPKVMA